MKRHVTIAGRAMLAALGACLWGGCAADSAETDRRGDRLTVLDNTRWVLEDQVDLFSETSIRRGAARWGWFFSPDRGDWDEIAEQITDSSEKWGRLGEDWPGRNQPAQDVDLIE